MHRQEQQYGRGIPANCSVSSFFNSASITSLYSQSLTNPGTLDAISKFCNVDFVKGPIAAFELDPDALSIGERFTYDGNKAYCSSWAGGGQADCGTWPCSGCSSPDESVFPSVIWSNNQDGCRAKSRFNVPRGDGCTSIYESILDSYKLHLPCL